MLAGVGEEAGDLGEFELIKRLLARVGPLVADVLIGPGDDAAAVRLGPGATLATSDLLLEGVHFEFGLSSPADVGWKALAVNLSDIAAMGGAPRYALVSLGAPAAVPVATLEALYDGIGECAGSFGVSVIGGDTVRADRVIVSVAVLGEAGHAGMVTRSGARPGDVLCVTGSVGGAAEGLSLLQAAGDDPQAAGLLTQFPGLAVAHQRPTPRTREGQTAAGCGATAMIDVSDGLAADVCHICEASGVGVEIREASIPLPDGFRDTARWAGVDPLRMALDGGDDYELAIAIPAAQVSQLVEALAPTVVTPIGEFVGSERVAVRADGTREPLDALGWDHFKEEP